jgi:chemotaxis protein histidine kinase CheA
MSRVRRLETGRRNSPASQTVDQARSAQEAADNVETIKELTERLDALRREIDDVEKQIQEEDDEFQAQKAALVEKRDEKRAALKEKEDTSRDLRKEVNTLERSVASAQARKERQERLLRQKEAERKKLKDDVARWEREAVELRAAADAIEQERAVCEREGEAKIQALKDKYADEIQTNKSLEEVIREKGTQIKALEKEREALEEGDAGAEAQEGIDTADAEEERQWAVKLASLQLSYANAWSLLGQAERAHQDAQTRLHYLQQRRLSQPQLFATLQLQEPTPRRRNSQRSRPVSMREPFASAAPGGFVHSSAAPFNSSNTNASPPFPNATPYFNINNGMALPPPNSARNTRSFSQAEFEGLTGGAPMSPTAGALLPSGLFTDESGMTDVEDDDDPGPPQPSQNPSPHLPHILPGLGAPGTFEHDPSSPVSVQSRSPFTSPRESAGQLGYFPTSDNIADSDRRSIRSTSSSFVNQSNLPTTRFGSLFGLNRQRGKTLSDQGPPLGSLKPTQSQSLPRQDPAAVDPYGTEPRRGSHSEGAWYNALLRSSKTQPVEPSNNPKHVATRKRAFNMFGGSKGGDPWLTSNSGLEERPSSPRQGSTKSSEVNLLPRPSTESHTRFGWPGSVEGFGGARNSPLGVDWSMNNTTSWSRMPSRRPSLQHGSTVSLINDELLQGGIPDFPSTSKSPTQAPIGTRPQSSASRLPPDGHIPPTPPKGLNPAAPNFKSIFTRGSEEEKQEKARKAAEKAAEKEAKRAQKEEEKKAKAEKSSDKAARKERDKWFAQEQAASESGKDTHTYTHTLDAWRSRDARSISTADVSEASPRESLERTISLASSDAQPASASGKETFMQKLSRKSSSSQFLQFSKGKASLFSKKTNEPSTPPVETEENDHNNTFLTPAGRSVDSSAANSPSIGTPKDKSSALSWSSIKRMGKRGDKTPSLHESVASETTGDEEEVVAEGAKK